MRACCYRSVTIHTASITTASRWRQLRTCCERRSSLCKLARRSCIVLAAGIYIFVAITSRVARCWQAIAAGKKKKKSLIHIPRSEKARCVNVARATGRPLATAAVLTRREGMYRFAAGSVFFCVVASCSRGRPWRACMHMAGIDVEQYLPGARARAAPPTGEIKMQTRRWAAGTPAAA